MGLGIANTHYLGMAAMRLQATPVYDKALVALSVKIAISASLVALWLAFQLREDHTLTGSVRKIGSAIVMGLAIAGMDYTATAADTFRPTNQSVAPFLYVKQARENMRLIYQDTASNQGQL